MCNTFSDFNVRNIVKTENIFTSKLCFQGEMQRYPTFIEFYTFLDSDFSTLIENRYNFQFSRAVYAKSTRKHTCFKPRKITRSCLFPFNNVPSWRYLCPFCMLLNSFWWEQRLSYHIPLLCVEWLGELVGIGKFGVYSLTIKIGLTVWRKINKL